MIIDDYNNPNDKVSGIIQETVDNIIESYSNYIEVHEKGFEVVIEKRLDM